MPTIKGEAVRHLGAILILTVVLSAGCATNMPTIDALKETPPERVFLKERRPDSAIITVLRTKEAAASAVNLRLLANGKPAAEIAWAEWASFSVPAGEVVLEIRHPSALWGAVGDSVVLNATPGAKYFYRVGVDVGVIKLLRTTEESVTPH